MSAITTTPKDFAGMCASYLQIQLGGDRRAALRFIDEALRDGASADDLHAKRVSTCTS
jgi:hypothetical protein